MGREATCTVRVGTQTAEVKALLESTELILRGAIKRRYAITALQGVQAVDGELRFLADGERVVLQLGAADAASWAKKIATPSPSLAAKLGVSPDKPAFVFGTLDDAVLRAALKGHTTGDVQAASLLVALMHTQAELDAAIAQHQRMPCAAMWAVYPKGRGVALTDASIRTALRALGYVDNKSSAVSDTLTATRYVRR